MIGRALSSYVTVTNLSQGSAMPHLSAVLRETPALLVSALLLALPLEVRQLISSLRVQLLIPG